MGMVNVLWLSRHAPTKEQAAYFDMIYSGLIYSGLEVEMIHINCTFPSNSEEATQLVYNLAEEHNCRDISGVFPAHIAARFMREDRCFNFYFPVSVPSPAKEGEVRGSGFVHSHFEMF